MKNIFIIVILFLTSCQNKSKNETQTEATNSIIEVTKLTDAQLNSAKIELGNLEQHSIASTIKLTGKIDVPPQNMISISMPLGGYLKATKLLPGMHVSQGEIIATMEDQQYIQLQQDYLTTKSKLEFADAELLRQKELNQQKASSDKILQLAQMEFNNLKITCHALAEKLKLININPAQLNVNTISKSINIASPINGYVSKVNVNIGKYVNPSDILFELVNPNDIHLNLQVFERDLNKLIIGQKLMAYNNNEPNKKHPCEIILIGKDLTAERSADVHCHFEDYDKTLLPGMYMNADIEIKNNLANVVPEDAVVRFEGKEFLFISTSKNEFEMKEIKKGVTENNFVEILNAADFANKKIVLKNAYTILMASKNKSEDD
jgi:membrane fusion protein, heavy metal efflux system